MFGFSWKDLTVAVASAIPVAGPLVGAAVGGIWTGIETGSVTEGIKAAAIDGAMAAIPGGKILGTVAGKMAAPLTEKLLGTAGGKVVGKFVGNNLGKIGKYAMRSGGKGLGRSLGRAAGRAAGGLAGSALTPDGGSSPDPTLGQVPTRLAGSPSATKVVFGSNDTQDTLNYDKYGLAQYPTTGKVKIKLDSGDTVDA
ncbi:hypothetical protein K7711_40140 [Nocardia sp. CA2R105]|uniref:hypothetical protein n=1 Tax=Nocardia coffeae TaxID=2873381 RepID=UPI001CA77CF9|nr:hypothetical protein [Nocardia coffeae]MBY8862735.1 hypothetical protein [Nocardia coffeae]